MVEGKQRVRLRAGLNFAASHAALLLGHAYLLTPDALCCVLLRKCHGSLTLLA